MRGRDEMQCDCDDLPLAGLAKTDLYVERGYLFLRIWHELIETITLFTIDEPRKG